MPVLPESVTKDDAYLLMCGSLLIVWVGYVGYMIWRDRKSDRDLASFQEKVKARQDEIKERLDVGQWEAEQ